MEMGIKYNIKQKWKANNELMCPIKRNGEKNTLAHPLSFVVGRIAKLICVDLVSFACHELVRVH